MAEIKWIKLTTDMFDNRKIKHLRKLPDGNNIVLIWVMLLTMAGRCNAGGMIFLTENIAYTPKMLADELGFEETTVQLALTALENFNMIVTNSGFFTIAGWEEYQNIEGMDKIREQNRLRQAKFKAKQKSLPGNVSGNVIVTPGNATEREEDIDIERDREGDKKRETTHTLFNRLLPDYIIPENLAAKMAEWITYKTERKEPYKEQGMKTLLRQIENNQLTYGEKAVCDLIDDSMANGWKGIIFDRLKNKPVYGRKEAVPKWMNKPREMDDDEKAAIQRMMAEDNPELAERAEKLRLSLQESGG